MSEEKSHEHCSAGNVDERSFECWRGKRKVTVYKDEVLRVWGVNMDTEMSSERATLETVQAAFDWLYTDEPQTSKVTQPLIGGTNWCGHGMMASLCPTCSMPRPQSSLGQPLTVLTVDLSNPVAGDAK